MRLRTSGFFASKTIGLDLNPMQAMDNYGIRDDQEVGNQVEICKAFGFDIPIGCTPTYTSKAKSATPRRGRPPKPKTEAQDI